MCYLLLSCWWKGVETLFLTEDIADVLSLVVLLVEGCGDVVSY